jgi:hypothetical protein
LEFVKVGLLVPALTPFTCHWYTGLLPALVAVAVKVIGVLEHTPFTEPPAAMLNCVGPDTAE